MSKFEIKNFFQFEDGSAKFSLNTAQGMYYEMKLVAYSGGHFITSAQSRPYDKSDGSKGYANAFGALKDSAAAEFFDEVTEEAKKLLRTNGSGNAQSGQHNAQSGNSGQGSGQSGCTGQHDCDCPACGIPFN